jgi:hypothetical protein
MRWKHLVGPRGDKCRRGDQDKINTGILSSEEKDKEGERSLGYMKEGQVVQKKARSCKRRPGYARESQLVQEKTWGRGPSQVWHVRVLIRDDLKDSYVNFM